MINPLHAWQILWIPKQEAEELYPRGSTMALIGHELTVGLIAKFLNGRVISHRDFVYTIETSATGAEIFEAERLIRLTVNAPVELMCGRKQDENKLRVKLAKFRGIGEAT